MKSKIKLMLFRGKSAIVEVEQGINPLPEVEAHLAAYLRKSLK